MLRRHRQGTVGDRRKRPALRLEDSEQWGPSVEVGPWGCWGSKAEGGRHLPALPFCRVGADRGPVCVHFFVVLSCAALRPFWNGGSC